jgi:hypothetical protein
MLQETWRSREAALTLTSDARSLWETFYRSWKQREWHDALLAALVERIPDNCLKIALIYAVLEQQSAITREVLEVALDVGAYAVASAQRIFGTFYASREARHEAKMEKILDDAGGQLPMADLQRRLSGRVSSGELSRLLGTLEKLGEVEIVLVAGSRRRCVRLL